MILETQIEARAQSQRGSKASKISTPVPTVMQVSMKRERHRGMPRPSNSSQDAVRRNAKTGRPSKSLELTRYTKLGLERLTTSIVALGRL